jgi:hypothetical protein
VAGSVDRQIVHEPGRLALSEEPVRRSGNDLEIRPEAVIEQGAADGLVACILDVVDKPAGLVLNGDVGKSRNRQEKRHAKLPISPLSYPPDA